MIKSLKCWISRLKYFQKFKRDSYEDGALVFFEVEGAGDDFCVLVRSVFYFKNAKYKPMRKMFTMVGVMLAILVLASCSHYTCPTYARTNQEHAAGVISN